MDKTQINLIGGGFQHSVSTNDSPPKYIEWVKGYGNCEIAIHVDDGLLKPVGQSTKNYGWLCESKTIISSYYDWCEKNTKELKSKFVKVFTHDVELSKKSDIFQLTQCSGKSFLNHGEIYPKTKLVSMIASNKTFCPDHHYRQEMIKKFSNKCDHFGRGYNQIPNKEYGLKDYCFSIVMENATYPNMFTEKITDCFMTGIIPVYYGIENIGDFFDSNGIIKLTDDFKIENLSFELYYSKMDSVKKNFEIATNLLTSEDYIFYNYIKNH